MTDNPYRIQIKKSITLQIVSALFSIVLISGILLIFSKQAALWFALAIAFFAVIGIFFRYLYLKSINYSVDAKSFTFKGGIISRFEKILPYSKIQHVIIYESFWQRVFGISSVSIETARGSVMQQNMQYGRGNQDNSLAGMMSPLIPDLKTEEADALRKYIIAASNIRYKPVAGV
jgi:membrane protein YdbS with pleckstrin-like domain